MITKVRSAHPSIILDGTDYYSSLAPYLVSMEYTDNSDGKKADDLNIELADRDGKFIAEWMPKKGAFLDAGIITENWFAPYSPALTLDCGRFWIDSVNFDLPGRKVSVKATSIPTNVRLKGSTETRGWEDAKLQDIAQQIAEENNMELDWQAQVNPKYRRTEQHDESGLAFLKKRCTDAKLAIKIHRNKIVVFDEQKLEEAEPAFTLLYGNLALGGIIAAIGEAISGTTYRMAGGHFSTKVIDTGKKQKVSHIDPESGDVKTGKHETDDDDGDDDRDTTDTDTDEDTGEKDTGNGEDLRAEPGSETGGYADDTASSGSSLKAKSRNREKNKEKDKATVELSLGNPLVASGQTFNLQGCGQFDGKWFIESAHHSVGPEYKTELSIRKCLKGY